MTDAPDVGDAIREAQRWVAEVELVASVSPVLADVAPRVAEAKRNLAALGEPSVALAVAAQAVLATEDVAEKVKNGEATMDEYGQVIVAALNLTEEALADWAQRVGQQGKEKEGWMT